MNEGGTTPAPRKARRGLTTEGMITMAAKTTKTVFTATALAAECETDPRTLRKFLRSSASGIDPVGKGARYNLEFTATQLGKIKKNFAEWTAAGTAAKVQRESDKAAKKLNVLTVTPASEGVDEVDEELDPDFADMTDEEIDEFADNKLIEMLADELATEDEV